MHITGLKQYGALIVILVTISSAKNATAWDGEREGFILGLGWGPGLSISFGDEDDYHGLGLDFKIGYAFSNWFQIYFVEKVISGPSRSSCGDSSNTTAIIGAGTAYYFGAESPAFYIMIELGMTVSDFGEASGHDEEGGFGLTSGVGFEFAPNWSVELEVIWAPVEERNGLAVMLSLNLLGY